MLIGEALQRLPGGRLPVGLQAMALDFVEHASRVTRSSSHPGGAAVRPAKRSKMKLDQSIADCAAASSSARNSLSVAMNTRCVLRPVAPARLAIVSPPAMPPIVRNPDTEPQ